MHSRASVHATRRSCSRAAVPNATPGRRSTMCVAAAITCSAFHGMLLCMLFVPYFTLCNSSSSTATRAAWSGPYSESA